MNRIRNKGVTFFEIVISVVIFGILISPIVAKMIQTLKTADSAKVTQNRYELAENIIENIKNADDFGPETVSGNAYINSISDGSVVKYPATGTATVTSADATGSYTYDGYVVTGTTSLGKKDEKYYYAIALDNQEYARLKHVYSYNDPNSMTLATIENLDASQLALINGTINNYDLTVTNAFMSKKLDILKVGDRERWEQYTKQQADIVAFPNDTVKRVIEIKVSSTGEGATAEYTVKCKLRYEESSNVVLKDGQYKNQRLSDYLDPIEYDVYEKTFEGSLPHIYLMYNPCLYNNNYMVNDYILLDTTGFEPTKSASEKSKVDLFIVETAERFSQTAADAYQSAYAEVFEGKTAPQSVLNSLINDETIRARDGVQINLIGKTKNAEATATNGTSEYVTIYNNFELASVASGSATVNKKNSNVVCTDVYPISEGVVASGSASDAYYELQSTQIKHISNAITNASPLYNVKVYFSTTPYTSTDYTGLINELNGMKPIITGTKGGN